MPWRTAALLNAPIVRGDPARILSTPTRGLISSVRDTVPPDGANGREAYGEIFISGVSHNSSDQR
jgi:hypothetical protein